MRLIADLSTEILQVRMEWQNIFKVMKGKNLQPRKFSTTRPDFVEGNGTPLHYSCLENPTDGGTW